MHSPKSKSKIRGLSRVILPKIMKPFIPLTLISLFILGAFASVFAQQGPPPPLAPDYDPKGWKEYSFAKDNVRFRFPVQPKRVESTTGTAKNPSSTYSRESFMFFSLIVSSHPESFDAVADKKALLDRGMSGMLDGMKNLEPKVIIQEDVSVDGHPARFLKVETNNGLVLRVKFFSWENKLYIGQVVSKKGDRHGFNWENDFEIPAMAFLDSLHLIATK
jgi:hypothetical protein